MPTPPATFLRHVASQLAARRDELDLRLHAAVLAATGDSPSAGSVRDTKEAAADESEAALTDAELAHAAHERDQVLAALRRVQDGTYGTCAECGQEIPARRLEALPAATLCTACQAAHERRTGR